MEPSQEGLSMWLIKHVMGTVDNQELHSLRRKAGKRLRKDGRDLGFVEERRFSGVCLGVPQCSNTNYRPSHGYHLSNSRIKYTKHML